VPRFSKKKKEMVQGESGNGENTTTSSTGYAGM
jgi:hypothetical protein